MFPIQSELGSHSSEGGWRTAVRAIQTPLVVGFMYANVPVKNLVLGQCGICCLRDLIRDEKPGNWVVLYAR
jgi:hypothetical protein